MDRREFGKLVGLTSVGTGMAARGAAQSPNYDDPAAWKSGQDSPVHDSDRLLPLSQRRVTIENAALRLSFDERTGGLTEFVSKKLGWKMLKNEKLAESFRIFVPTSERDYNPILGARNFAVSVQKSADNNRVTIVWKHLVSEYMGTLDITLTAVATLDGENVGFDVTVDNRSKEQVASVEWPVFGGWTKLPDEKVMRRLVYDGSASTAGPGFSTRFENKVNGCGVSFPMQDWNSLFALLMGEKAGLYLGSHDLSMETYVRYTLELKPGWLQSGAATVPHASEVSDHPIRFVLSVVQYPFAAPGETIHCRHVVASPYQGGWQQGVDVFKRWQKTWYKEPAAPEWSKEPQGWAQIEINSSEGDLRTAYKDLPRRGMICAKVGIKALQLSGWNRLGEDRDDPSQATDARLGTHEDLKDAIAQIEKMGVRVVLFNKYTWADSSTEWYRNELEPHMVRDPNGCTYQIAGYKYQTPVQLGNINTRRLISACEISKDWQNICRKEFQKVLDLAPSGMLYGDVANHGEAHACFATNHGHRVGTGLRPGTLALSKMFRDMAREQRGEGNFLFGGEAIWEGLSLYYSLSSIHAGEAHIPVERYINPHINIMMAINGFDDREMINAALRFRYLMSFEPFFAKGNMDDYPLTMEYGRKVEAFRVKHRQWLWDAEFLGTEDSAVSLDGSEGVEHSVFRTPDGKHAVVLANNSKMPATIKVKFAENGRGMNWATPEEPELRAVSAAIRVAPRSAVLVVAG